MRNLGNIYKYLIKLIYNREFIIIHLPNHKEHMGTICCNEENKENASNGVQKKVYASPPTNYQKQLSNREVAGLPAKNSGIACLSEEIHIARHGIQNYQSIKYLGRGTFGDVVLAEDKQTNIQYAIKVIEKRKIKQFNVLQSQRIRKISENPLFASIRETLQNQSKIYIVMQYLPRGDIYYYLKRKQCLFTEEIIKNLVSQIIIGIEILHQQDIIYRELKPQNILVTKDGHVKLTDYGLSKMIVEEHNALSTFIGALEYTAPEALQGHYGKKVDLWAIGVLMFQLRFDRNLFENNQYDTNQEIQSNIQKTNMEEVFNGLVGLISHDFRDVLIKLLQKDPEQRISLQQLKKHPFFEGVDWSKIPQRKNPSPLKSFLELDHIKFRDPTNQSELAHRKIIENKNKCKEFKASLYEFRSLD